MPMLRTRAARVDSSLLGTQGIFVLLPGLLLVVAVMLPSVLLTQTVRGFLPWEKNPLSAILVAVIVSLSIRVRPKVAEG